jgi:hypothetical protein
MLPGRTYYWAVDQLDADGTVVAKGDMWSFVARPYFAAERDTVSQWPNPDENILANPGAKFLQVDPGPGAMSSAASDQTQMLHKVIATSKIYGKNQHLLALAEAWDTASRLGSDEGAGSIISAGIRPVRVMVKLGTTTRFWFTKCVTKCPTYWGTTCRDTSTGSNGFGWAPKIRISENL